MSVFTSPGAMEFTRTLGASSAANVRVRCKRAALVALYAPIVVSTERPPIDAMFKTVPPWSCIHACHASWVHMSGAAQLTEIVLSSRGRSMSMVLPM